MSNYKDKRQTRPFGLFGWKRVNAGATAPANFKYYAIRACNDSITVNVTAASNWADDLTSLTIAADQVFEGNISGFSVTSGSAGFAVGYIESKA